MIELTPLHPWIAQKTACAPEALTRAVIAAYQLDKLNETLALCRARSPFYRQKLAGLPEKLSSLADLQTLPFTTADDVRERPLSLLCVSQSEIARVVTLDTSGTSGPPKRLYFTTADQELTRDFFHVGMSTFTGAGDRVLILLPGERPGSVGDLLAQALPRLEATGVPHGLVANVAQTLDVLHREQAAGVVGMPVQVLALVRTAVAQQMPRPHLKSILLTTDHVPAAIVQAVEDAWGGTVYNHYGMTEMGLGGGVQCAARTGYHLREADLFFEIVDPGTGEPVPDGAYGELVFTTLTRQGMPLIRYRTGDISRFLLGACACDTVLRRLETVRYRWHGRFPHTSANFLTMADLDDTIFPLPGVLDFAASVSATQLQVTVQAEGVGGLATAVTETIMNLPAVRQLGLVVSVQVQPGRVSPPGKRKLASPDGTALG
ncbi:MAG: phenylacetate--CoA ligase family protein [Anaerolineaceae bacterium]|nr:phenylacetate--CoA ligase family protein [Anaerolineaceae bacterium]